MAVTDPLQPEQAPEEAQALFEKIKDLYETAEVPTEFRMMGWVPPFAGDAFQNQQQYIKNSEGALTHPQREALALATSAANNCKSCVRSHAHACQEAGWSEGQVAEILAVTATAAMYNVFYKFQHGVSDDGLAKTKPMLRAHTWHKTSLDATLTELIAILVSVINSCDYCIDAHTHKALNAGVTREQIQEAMRLSATMTAFNQYFRIQ
jgi:alkyl hydroperoxide reductase subunit D